MAADRQAASEQNSAAAQARLTTPAAECARRASLNSVAANPGADGSVTIQFGGCRTAVSNCLPIMPRWNDTITLSQPRREVLNGTWRFPEAQPCE
jgi:hypothetical protein